MAQLLVRGIDEELVQRLKMRAARNGTSAEEEHRRILRAVLSEPKAPRPLKEPDRGRPVEL